MNLNQRKEPIDESRTRIFAWIMSGLVILPAAGLAQDDKEQKEGAKQDLPGPFTSGSASWRGRWNVSIRYIIGDKQHEGKATCEAKLILGGRFLQQEYTSRFQGQPFHVLQILGYDNAKKKSIEIMMDTMGTGVLHNEGTVSDDGKVITNIGRVTRSRRPESPTSCAPSRPSSTTTTSRWSGSGLTTAARKPRSSRCRTREKRKISERLSRRSRVEPRPSC